MTGFVSSQEIFSLKKSYDSQVFIEGTDQVSIKQGKQLALSSLLVNLSGNSKIVNEKSIRVMMDTPEKYITQYRLGTEDKKIYASFIFEGDLIRSYLSENALPLWLSNDNLILSYLPCKEESDTIKSEEENDSKRITFTPGNKLLAKDYDVVGDFSSAAFLIIAGLIANDSKISIKNVGLNPTRSGLIDILIKMGGNIEIKNKNILSGELVGDIFVESSVLKGVNISGGVIANIIDEIPILSIAAACAEGTTRISDAHELRVKESDRLEAISSGLTKLKVKHELFGAKFFFLSCLGGC